MFWGFFKRYWDRFLTEEKAQNYKSCSVNIVSQVSLTVEGHKATAFHVDLVTVTKS